MTKREQFKLHFFKEQLEGTTLFRCDNQEVTIESFNSASILDRLSKAEAEGLISEIDNAINGAYYEQYFSLNNSMASDEDGIEIAAPNIIFNSVLSIPFKDAKMLIQEWLDFLNS